MKNLIKYLIIEIKMLVHIFTHDHITSVPSYW